MKKNEPKETEIQATICEYLAVKKHIFWRQNTTSIYDPARQTFRKMPKYSVAGVSDIILLKDGVTYFLEVKRKNTKQSPSQLLFEAMVRKGGARYEIVRSVEDVIELGF